MGRWRVVAGGTRSGHEQGGRLGQEGKGTRMGVQGDGLGDVAGEGGPGAKLTDRRRRAGPVRAGPGAPRGQAMGAERARRREAELQRGYLTAEKLGTPLDPLLAALAHFHSSADLSAKIAELFALVDANGSGSLDYAELREGLASLEAAPVRKPGRAESCRVFPSRPGSLDYAELRVGSAQSNQ